MNKIIKTVALACTVSLTACSSNTANVVFKPSAIDDGMANIILYRPGNMSNAIYSPQLYIDDTPGSTIKNRKKISLSVTPGNHTLDIDKENDYQGETQLHLKASAGQSYYIRVETSLKLNQSTNYQPYHRTFDLRQVDEATAVSEITDCCMDSPKQASKTEKEIVEEPKEPDSGFSVEKTQNPFSH